MIWIKAALVFAMLTVGLVSILEGLSSGFFSGNIILILSGNVIGIGLIIGAVAIAWNPKEDEIED